MAERVRFWFDGRELRAPAGSMLAAALANAGVLGLRRSLSGEPRGALCGMGICHECRVSVDGRAHVRACLVECREGLRVESGHA